MQELQDDQRVPFWRRCDDSTAKDRRNLLRSMSFMGLWALTFIGGGQALKRGLVGEGPLAWTLVLLPSVPAILFLFAYARYLRETDELQRLIQISAMALSFGGTFFAMAGYQLAEKAGAGPADLGDFTFVMAILYSLGLVIGWMRYR